MSVKYVSAYVFIAFLLIGFVLAVLSHLLGTEKFPDVTSFLNGQASSSYEKEFDKNLDHRDISIYSWNNLGYALFKEGKKGVLIGQDGWLFTTEEFDGGKDFVQNFNQNKDYIVEISKRLKEDNVSLVSLIIPSKSRIYQDKLGRYEFPAYWQTQYQNLINYLNDNNISVVDLLKDFEKSKLENIYLKTDTHWTPLGARLASLKIDYMITSEFPYLNWPIHKFVSKELDEESYEGDLMRYTINGDSAEKFGFQKDRFYKWETISTTDNQDDLFGYVVLPVTLVGTSYSANKMWNFEGFLKEALGTDILNVADEGLGPFEVMNNYINSDVYKNSKPKLIIWEIPERYLVQSFDKKEVN